jgi:hypothetical protein
MAKKDEVSTTVAEADETSADEIEAQRRADIGLPMPVAPTPQLTTETSQLTTESPPMVLHRVCPTCKGWRQVHYGAQVYLCPTCGGSGGIPLGSVPEPVAEPVPGHSRAAQHVARGHQTIPRR